MKKTGRERSQAVERALFPWTEGRRTGWLPFRGVTKSGRVRRKGPDKEAWSLASPVACHGLFEARHERCAILLPEDNIKGAAGSR